MGEDHRSVVTWNPGLLRPYESVTSFAVKFCRLNAISVNGFYDYLMKFFTVDRQPGFRYLDSLFLSRSIDFSRLAKELGESLSILQSMTCEDIFPYHAWNPRRGAPFYNKFRYCPECIKIGYHATYHLLPWFNRCLIHKTSLINIPSQQTRYIKDGHDRQIRLLSSLLFAENSALCFDPNTWNKPQPRIGEEEWISTYTTWLRQPTIKMLADCRRDILVMDLSDDGSNAYDQFLDFFHIACYLVPPDPEIQKCLAPSALSIKPLSLIFSGIDVADFRETLISQDFYSLFCDVRRNQCGYEEMDVSWRRNIRRALYKFCRAGRKRSVKQKRKGMSREQSFIETYLNNALVGRTVKIKIRPAGYLHVWSDAMVRHTVSSKSGIFTIRRMPNLETGDYRIPQYHVAYGLRPPWDQVADLILDARMYAKIWELFGWVRRVPVGRMLPYEAASNSWEKKMHFPIIVFRLNGDALLEMQLWSVYPDTLPF